MRKTQWSDRAKSRVRDSPKAINATAAFIVILCP